MFANGFCDGLSHMLCIPDVEELSSCMYVLISNDSIIFSNSAVIDLLEHHLTS